MSTELYIDNYKRGNGTISNSYGVYGNIKPYETELKKLGCVKYQQDRLWIPENIKSIIEKYVDEINNKQKNLRYILDEIDDDEKDILYEKDYKEDENSCVEDQEYDEEIDDNQPNNSGIFNSLWKDFNEGIQDGLRDSEKLYNERDNQSESSLSQIQYEKNTDIPVEIEESAFDRIIFRRNIENDILKLEENLKQKLNEIEYIEKIRIKNKIKRKNQKRKLKEGKEMLKKIYDDIDRESVELIKIEQKKQFNIYFNIFLILFFAMYMLKIENLF